MDVLVIGSGGREDCLVWKVTQSPLVDKVYIAPGNGGTSLKGQNIDIKDCDIDSLLKFAAENNVGLTVVGPEAPLVAGLVDRFEAQGLKVFGPGKELARLEGSKLFAKEMSKKKSQEQKPEQKPFSEERDIPIHDTNDIQSHQQLETSGPLARIVEVFNVFGQRKAEAFSPNDARD